MSDRLGPIKYDSSDQSIFIGRDFGTTKSYSEETAAAIDEEVRKIFDEASRTCEQILTEHAEQLRTVAEYLLVHETMEGDEFEYFFEHGTFMPEEEKQGRKARYDRTIERPARKIARFDEPAEPPVATAQEETAPAPTATEETASPTESATETAPVPEERPDKDE